MNSLTNEIKTELARRELSRRNLLDFTQYTMDDFDPTWFHKVYYEILDRFTKKDIKKLMVTVGPQNGKSEGSSRRLPAFALGVNPDLKIGLASYSSAFAQLFSLETQRIIDDQPYYNLFPGTKLPKSQLFTTSATSFKKTQGLFEILDRKGSLKAVGRGGGLTGSKIDLMIMDDLYKDYAEGNSPVIREAVINWYLSVIIKRLHNDSQQLIVFTRWDIEDLIGWLERKETVKEITCWADIDYFKEHPDHWAKINFPTLKTGEPTELDPREKGEALWPERHSRASKEAERKLDPEKFDGLEQGDPQPKTGLLYQSGFKTYIQKPELKELKAYCDVADEGDDYLCLIVYGVGIDDYIYILDVLYTQESEDITQQQVADMLRFNKVRQGDFESNNGGKGYAKAVKQILNNYCVIDWHYQGANKVARIKVNAAQIMNRVLMPYGWKEKFPLFSTDISRFKKNILSNKHDDAPDALTGCLEFSGILEEDYSQLYKF